MFDNICTLPLSSDLFAQAIHPTSSIVAVGLAAGHVETYVLPQLDSSPDHTPQHGCGTIETSWRTKRHNGSCRSLTFSSDGETIFSAGTDGIVKAAKTENGQVYSKIAVPLYDSLPDAPSLIHALSPQSLLLATDSSALYLYDLRTSSTPSSKPQQTYYPHYDYISSLTPLPPTSASTSGHSKQFVTTGGTTLAVTDIRRGVLVKSEDQEEELLSSVIVSGVGKGGRSEKTLVGSGDGVVTVWEKGNWVDQEGRILLGGVRKESLDAMAVLPEEVGEGNMVGVGMGDGRVRFVRVGPNQVVGEVRHDEFEGVLGLGFEVGGRMVSGGGGVVKVWHVSVRDEEGEPEEGRVGAKRGVEDRSRDIKADGQESSEEEEKVKKQRKKKQKRAKGRAKDAEKHIMAFKGLD